MDRIMSYDSSVEIGVMVTVAASSFSATGAVLGGSVCGLLLVS
jgi:hypothetical protein